jgi:hypothetical protein
MVFLSKAADSARVQTLADGHYREPDKRGRANQSIVQLEGELDLA